MSEMLEMAARCEAATIDQQRNLMLDAFAAINGGTPAAVMYDSGTLGQRTDADRYRYCVRFLALLDNEAFLDAAMSLVPDNVGMSFTRSSAGRWSVLLYNSSETIASGDTRALALCAAALRARSEAAAVGGR